MEVQKINKLLHKIFTFLIIVWLLLPKIAIAQTIEDNNSGSTNSIEQSTSSNTQITQTNDSNIGSSVTVSLTTGGNSVNGSSGDASINTGSTSFAATVENQTNSSTVETGCCASPTPTIKISDNNSDTGNSIVTNNNSSNTVEISQNASITNNFNVTLDTGGNNISDSTGNSNIKTGNVYTRVNVENGPINGVDVTLNEPNVSYSTIISNNNSGSTNSIFASNTIYSNVNIDNKANINNYFNLMLGTGNNGISNNKGSASILTGDIFLALNVKNGPINVSEIELNNCACSPIAEPTPTAAPTSTLTPTPTPTSESGRGGDGGSNGGGGGGGGGGDSIAQRVESMVLGSTGSFMENLFYVFFILGSVFVGLGMKKGISLDFSGFGSGFRKKVKSGFVSFRKADLEIVFHA